MEAEKGHPLEVQEKTQRIGSKKESKGGGDTLTTDEVDPSVIGKEIERFFLERKKKKRFILVGRKGNQSTIYLPGPTEEGGDKPVF